MADDSNVTLSLEELMRVDIQDEIEKHKKLEAYRENYENIYLKLIHNVHNVIIIIVFYIYL